MTDDRSEDASYENEGGKVTITLKEYDKLRKKYKSERSLYKLEILREDIEDLRQDIIELEIIISELQHKKQLHEIIS